MRIARDLDRAQIAAGRTLAQDGPDRLAAGRIGLCMGDGRDEFQHLIAARIERRAIDQQDVIADHAHAGAIELIEQFRVGALDKSQNPWLLELVAGLIDKDEEPEQVARREAIEEAGLTLGALWPISAYYPSPGGSDERVHLYVGRCDSRLAAGIHGLEEEGEDIRVHVWSFEEALQAVRDGRIDNAASIIALQWLALNRAEVRGLWV